MNLNVVILAAGMGKRMNSTIPKVLHKIGNKPMLQHVLESAKQLNPNKIIIVRGHGGKEVQDIIDDYNPGNNFIWVEQKEQLGTGHALKQAIKYLDNNGATLVLYGDVPLINSNTLQLMIDKYNSNIVMLTMVINNPVGYGRVIRDSNNKIKTIIEEKDATLSEKYIKEVNTGFYLLNNQYIST
ncbi:MAG: NTP transferase domain-containing protein, partial [Neisseriaceae bacterium]